MTTAAGMNPREHWDRVYRTKGDLDVSWFETEPTLSLRMIRDAGISAASCIVDIGGGNARLVEALLADGLRCLAVLDVSQVAIDAACARLGDAARAVTWIAADVTGDWSLPPVDIWHDRAVFHFLTSAEQRAAYRRRLLDTLRPGGHAILATFAPDGPEMCSGLPVVRYSSESLGDEFGAAFTLVDAVRHTHVTPWGAAQPFQYARLRRN